MSPTTSSHAFPFPLTLTLACMLHSFYTFHQRILFLSRCRAWEPWERYNPRTAAQGTAPGRGAEKGESTSKTASSSLGDWGETRKVQ